MINRPQNFPLVISLLWSALTLSVVSANVFALPFITFDAKSAALGGVGVTTGARNGAFYNPALLAAREDDVDGIVMFPSASQAIADPDDLEKELDALLLAIDNNNGFDAVAALNALTGSVYQKSQGIHIMGAIPSTSIAGSLYFSSQEYHSARAKVGNYDLSANPPIYDSMLEHRGITMFEQGVSVGKYLNSPDYLLNDFMVGVTVKLQLFQTYGYEEAINEANLKLKDKFAHNSGDLNIDIGIAKEYGVWNMGLVIKNIIKQTTHYGETDDTFTLAPQVRAGFAYQSRTMFLELDIDATKNQQVGYGSETQYVAAGWEITFLSAFNLRLGYQQNIIGNKLATFSYGLGVSISNIEISAAALTDEEGQGYFADILVKF